MLCLETYLKILNMVSTAIKSVIKMISPFYILLESIF